MDKKGKTRLTAALSNVPVPPQPQRPNVTLSRPTDATTVKKDGGIAVPLEYIKAQADDPDLAVPNQLYYVLSYVVPGDSDGPGCKNVMIKVSNVFPSEELADQHARKVRNQSHHKYISSYVLPIGVWVTVPRPKYTNQTCRKKYEQEMIDKIMDGNWRALEQSRKKLNDRKLQETNANLAKLRRIHGKDYVPVGRTEEQVEEERKALMESTPQEARQKAEVDMSSKYMGGMLAKYLLSKKGAYGPDGKLTSPEMLDEDLKKEALDFGKFVEETLSKSMAESSGAKPPTMATSRVEHVAPGPGAVFPAGYQDTDFGKLMAATMSTSPSSPSSSSAAADGAATSSAAQGQEERTTGQQ